MSFVASVDVLKVSNVTNVINYFYPRSAVIYPIIIDTEIPSKNWFDYLNNEQKNLTFHHLGGRITSTHIKCVTDRRGLFKYKSYLIHTLKNIYALRISNLS